MNNRVQKQQCDSGNTNEGIERQKTGSSKEAIHWDREEFVSAIVEALRKHDDDSRCQDIKRAFAWRLLEWIMITVFFGAVLWVCIAIIPIYKEEKTQYTCIEMIREIRKLENSRSIGTLDSDYRHKLADYYTTLSGLNAALIIPICLWIITMVKAGKHTKKEVIDNITLFAGLAATSLTLFQMLNR